MVNYLRMDLYRLGRSRSLWAALLADMVITALLLLPLSLGMRYYRELAAMGGEDPLEIEAAADAIDALQSTARDTLGDKFSSVYVNTLLALAAALYLRDEVKSGYIRNIAALQPTRLGLVLSKTAAFAVLALALQGVYAATNLAVTVIFMPGFTVGDIGWLPGLLVMSMLLLAAEGSMVMFIYALTRRAWAAAAAGWVLFGTGMGVRLLERAEVLTGLEMTRFSVMENLRELGLKSLSGGGAAVAAAVALGAMAFYSLLTALVLDRRDAM